MKLRFSCTIAVLLLAGCADQLGHEPEVKTSIVEKAVAVPCDPKLPERPALLTKDQILAQTAAIPKMGDRAKLVLDQLLLYIGWVPVLEAGLAGCAHPMDQNSPTTDATTR